MIPQFQYAVIGRGLTGSAAARHLAETVPGVVLIGPDEPENRANHQGVFASHYDEGRITRTIDADENWARFANRAIGRYREIEDKSGIGFYAEAGCLISGFKTGRSQDYISDVKNVASKFPIETINLDDAGLAARFPYFTFPSDSDAVFQPKGAGHVSPRRLVAAQTAAAGRVGAKVIRQEAASVRQKDGYADIMLANGETVTAARVLVAAGGFTNKPGLLPEPLDLKVMGRTVCFFEVDEAEAARLAAMPSMIFEHEDIMLGIYMLPPIRYPDGKIYLKIGGDPTDILLPSEQDVRDWFKTDGNLEIAEHLRKNVAELVPSLAVKSISTTSCVTSYPPTGYPAIGWTSSPSIAVMAGGCGSAAKSSDEIGRLGASLLLDGEIGADDYTADFAPRFL